MEYRNAATAAAEARVQQLQRLHQQLAQRQQQRRRGANVEPPRPRQPPVVEPPPALAQQQIVDDDDQDEEILAAEHDGVPLFDASSVVRQHEPVFLRFMGSITGKTYPRGKTFS